MLCRLIGRVTFTLSYDGMIDIISLMIFHFFSEMVLTSHSIPSWRPSLVLAEHAWIFQSLSSIDFKLKVEASCKLLQFYCFTGSCKGKILLIRENQKRDFVKLWLTEKVFKLFFALFYFGFVSGVNHKHLISIPALPIHPCCHSSSSNKAELLSILRCPTR